MAVIGRKYLFKRLTNQGLVKQRFSDWISYHKIDIVFDLETKEGCIASLNTKMHVRDILKYGTEAVKSDVLMKNFVKPLDHDKIQVEKYEYHLHKNIHIVGFGKAVTGMCSALEKVVSEHLKGGIISVPIGMKQSYIVNNPESKIKIHEGAKNNLPDNDALNAAKSIYNYVESLSPNDLLFIVISGGGSALLPYPKPPVTLDDKLLATKLLTSRGADIKELNSVRKRLSLVKGGGLSKIAKCQTVALILSDIVNDPIDLLASSPTVPNTDDPFLPLKILEKYNLRSSSNSDMPSSVIRLLSNLNPNDTTNSQTNIRNLIIGNNTMALNSCYNKAVELGYATFTLTRTLEGEAKIVGETFSELAQVIVDKDRDFDAVKMSNVFKNLPEKMNRIVREAREALAKGDSVCILSGGETTVVLNDTYFGKGGRNQEMVLAFSIKIGDQSKADISFASMGTDGIDGPTDAAGAVSYPGQTSLAITEGLDPELCLSRNDSYRFFSQFKDGVDHIKTGHTGTNVMDLQALIIKPLIK